MRHSDPAPVSMPPGIVVDERSSEIAPADPYRGVVREERELVLRRRCFDRQGLRLWLLVAAGNALFIFWSLRERSGDAAAIAAVLVTQVALGAALVHRGLAGLLNTATVRVGDGRLSLRHGPVPTFGDRDLVAGDVQRLSTVTRNVRGGVRYELHLVPRKGPLIKLASNLDDREQVRYLKRAVEEHLGLVAAQRYKKDSKGSMPTPLRAPRVGPSLASPSGRRGRGERGGQRSLQQRKPR